MLSLEIPFIFCSLNKKCGMTQVFSGRSQQFAAAVGELHGSKSRNIHTRQPVPRQKRFRIKGGRGDGALRIGDLLIASKVPKASDSAQSQGRPRNRFTAAVFRLPFVRTKGNVIKRERGDSQSRAGRSLGARRPATAFASLRSPQATPRKLSHYDACGSSEPRRLPPEQLRRAAALSAVARAKRDPRSRRR